MLRTFGPLSIEKGVAKAGRELLHLGLCEEPEAMRTLRVLARGTWDCRLQNC